MTWIYSIWLQKTRFEVSFPQDCPYSLEQLLNQSYF
ncbi:hypothetical protein CRC_00654 [Cylindrospermopsis raciborskii CS-505]|nr:hypothetical protein CRC_00654 [Cylindrospermopsis raciborskii CS-505]